MALPQPPSPLHDVDLDLDMDSGSHGPPIIAVLPPPHAPSSSPPHQPHDANVLQVITLGSKSPGKRSEGASSDGISNESTASTSVASRTNTHTTDEGASHRVVNSIAWDVSYTVTDSSSSSSSSGGGGGGFFRRAAAAKKKKKQVILQSVVGQAEAGDLVAVMGASGCGKSTFLNCLALRDQGFHGQVYMNEAPVDKWYLSLVGFVDQHDLFYPTQTVREHLEFHAMMRLESRKIIGLPGVF